MALLVVRLDSPPMILNAYAGDDNTSSPQHCGYQRSLHTVSMVVS